MSWFEFGKQNQKGAYVGCDDIHLPKSQYQPLPNKISTTNGTKRISIVHISDTHQKHDQLKLPHGDILIHTGDFLHKCSEMNDAAIAQIQHFNDWLGKQCHPIKIILCGNHESVFTKMSSSQILKHISNATHYLQDSAVTLYGIKFYGTPWSINTSKNQAFGFEKKDENKLNQKFDSIPTDTDILLHHLPPRNMHDLAWRGWYNFNSECPICGKIHTKYDHWGSEYLLNLIKNKIKPIACLYGHVHDANGTSVVDNILFCNSAMSLNPTQCHKVDVVFDLEVIPNESGKILKHEQKIQESQADIRGNSEGILLIAIDEKGTTQVYKDNILDSLQFEDWPINKCIRGKNMDCYYSNPSKVLNEQTKMWIFLKNRFPQSYNQMKQESMKKYDSMKNSHSALIESLSFNQIAAIYLYTTNYLYKALNRSLRDGTSEFADFAVELISAINKLPMVWAKTYRGLGANFTKYHSYIPNVYKPGNVVRWDGINSTNVSKQVALQFADKWVIEIDGYHGRDIQPFCAYPSEGEVLYLMSSHFLITGVYKENGKTFFKCSECPFPWSDKAILWVDDKPNNNKSLMERLERKGAMIIPRLSTDAAVQFMQYMKKILGKNRFRIVTNMSRFENNQSTKNRNAGAILVNELRKRGYNQQICIYTSNEQRAINACKKFGHENNISATTSEEVCFKFCSYLL